MLFSNEFDWDFLFVAVQQRVTEFLNRPLHTSGMMPQGSVRPISCEAFGFIKPIVNFNIVFGCATKPFGAANCVMIRRHVCSFGLFDLSTILASIPKISSVQRLCSTWPVVVCHFQVKLVRQLTMP
jgi:hypothetical protein